MKKQVLFMSAAFVCAMAAFTSCSKIDNPSGDSGTGTGSDEVPGQTIRVLTFEDADWKAGTNYLGQQYWSSLIDYPQYGGKMLYPTDAKTPAYNWSDDGNTFLAHIIVAGLYEDNQFYYGGHAVSNYSELDLSKGTYENQLAIPVATGHNGSKNFCVHFGSSTMMGIAPYLYFSDDVARVIDHMYVIPTTYTLNSIINGDGYTKSLVSQKGSLWITATGYDADGNETGSVQFDLCKDGVYVSDWTKFNLSALGKVVMVVFDMDGTDKGDWGLNTPAYFAYDDVAVQF